MIAPKYIRRGVVIRNADGTTHTVCNSRNAAKRLSRELQAGALGSGILRREREERKSKTQKARR